MTLTVCIPTYNYNALPLVGSIEAQKGDVPSVQVRTVCIDDCSDERYRELISGIAQVATYVQLPHNVGRARIRNLFLEHTDDEYLLFLDNDMVVPEGFLSRYAATLPQRPDVVVGGVAYDKRADNRRQQLKYRYAMQSECRSAAERSKQPYRSFMTGNFMVRRDVLERIRFDERVTGYGHEDTLFGYRLQQHGIPILHIDNPAINSQVECNEEFLHKSVEAVENMARIYGFMSDDRLFCRSVRLLRTYERLRNLHLQQVVYGIFRLLKPPLESHFVAGSAFSVGEFNFYKLGTLINAINNNKKTA